MLSDVLARVEAFAVKANELARKGHLQRAAENFGRGAEAACALGADNLAALFMQLRHANVLAALATAPNAASINPHILAGHRAECIALLSGAIAALERRRAAGTLLEGKHAAMEEAWRAALWQQLNPNMSAAKAASLAVLVAYEQYLTAAKDALDVLSRACRFAAECSDSQFESFAQHVVQAAELMQQPRRGHNDLAMDIEAQFTKALRAAVADASVSQLDARLVQLLAGASQRLQRSGVLQARRIDERIASIAPKQQSFRAAVQSSLTAPGLRSCALPGCGAREAHPAHFKSCAACRAVVYCCREHQVAGWPAHKKACKAAREAAAEEAGLSNA